jgi:hypothetical protein
MRKNFIRRLVEALQLDLVNGVREYNEERAHSGQVLLREDTVADVPGCSASGAGEDAGPPDNRECI